METQEGEKPLAEEEFLTIIDNEILLQDFDTVNQDLMYSQCVERLQLMKYIYLLIVL